ncbi:hypothetical protein [Fischerella sp. JS2]|uniref:hypothetical protein n=1 Tax=Fischerella sp. JS2 TaxID=2597771 RepID=UPI0028EB0DA1|nr:hypothetical protein [Fischerella sp. JS2]
MQFRSEPQICVTVFLLNLSEEEIREPCNYGKAGRAIAYYNLITSSLFVKIEYLNPTTAIEK